MENFERPEDEINFSKVLRSPKRQMVLIIPTILMLIIISVGMYWVYNLDAHYLKKIPNVKLQRDTVAVELTQKEGKAVAGIDIVELSKPNPAAIAKGKELYNSTCVSCHGANGKGDGVAAAALNPKPRDFTATSGWINGKKFSEMYKTLEEGIKGSGMVSYNFMPVSDRVDIIHYLHTLMSGYGKDTQEDLVKLSEAYKLGAGSSEPNQIPVAKAMSLIEKENANKEKLVLNIAKTLSDSNNPDYSIIVKAISNPERAAAFLMNNSDWKASQEVFYTMVSSNLNYNGFSSSFLRFKKDDVAKLYNYLQHVIVAPQA